MTDYRDLVVVANAEPYQHVRYDSSIAAEQVNGGLTTGLDPIMQDQGKSWVAWGRGDADFHPDIVDGQNTVRVPSDADSTEQYPIRRLDLSEDEKDAFYLGMSNRVLWPAFHGFTGKLSYSDEFWDTYCDVNQQYADAAVDVADDGDRVLVQDYQLGLVPSQIQDTDGGRAVGYFLHIPFPDPDDFTAIPHHEELFDGMSGSDLLGVHTERDVQHVLETADALDHQVDTEDSIYLEDGGTTRVCAIPLGIDCDRYTAPDTEDFEEMVRAELGVDHLLFGLDRTDYTKGLPEKLDAYDRFLADHEQYHGRVTLFQKLTPSRTDIDAYSDLIESVEQRAMEINDTYGDSSWTPVQLEDSHVPHEEMVGMYRAADVLLVTPVIDGMNLVAKEGVAANYTGQNDGILVIGENAGAAEQLDDAIIVDPTRTQETADAIETALRMSDSERRTRMARMHENVQEQDVDWWAESYLDELDISV